MVVVVVVVAVEVFLNSMSEGKTVVHYCMYTRACSSGGWGSLQDVGQRHTSGTYSSWPHLDIE